jgi:hypothetical protein
MKPVDIECALFWSFSTYESTTVYGRWAENLRWWDTDTGTSSPAHYATVHTNEGHDIILQLINECFINGTKIMTSMQATNRFSPKNALSLSPLSHNSNSKNGSQVPRTVSSVPRAKDDNGLPLGTNPFINILNIFLNEIISSYERGVFNNTLNVSTHATNTFNTYLFSSLTSSLHPPPETPF